MKTIRIATRGSQLALWQAEHVKARLLELDPSFNIEFNIIKTKGDIILDTSLAKIGGKGLFVKEIEESLLADESDIAVHSMKDVPFELPEGLGLHAILERENPYDAFVSNTYKTLEELPEGAIIGTSSLRRASQLKKRFKVETKLLRGNVNTRLAKLDNGDYDAIILASAGLIRLEMKERITQYIPQELMIPSPGQGAVGIECRNDDAELIAILQKLAHADTTLAVNLERQFNRAIGGSCQVPAGCFVKFDGETTQIDAFISDPEGQTFYQEAMTVKKSELKEEGKEIATKLLQDGGDKILKDLGI